MEIQIVNEKQSRRQIDTRSRDTELCQRGSRQVIEEGGVGNRRGWGKGLRCTIYRYWLCTRKVNITYYKCWPIKIFKAIRAKHEAVQEDGVDGWWFSHHMTSQSEDSKGQQATLFKQAGAQWSGPVWAQNRAAGGQMQTSHGLQSFLLTASVCDGLHVQERLAGVSRRL